MQNQTVPKEKMDNTMIGEKVLQVTKTIEKQVDAVIEQMDNLDANDLAHLRKERVKQMRELEMKRKEWLSNGHGSYEELPEEKMFFDVIKKSENVVIHFYTNTSQRSPIMEKHLKILAPKHIETRFVSLNAEKCPFLAERLKVKVIPTLVLINNGIMVDKIVGFTQLGNRDDFSTEILEWRIAQNGIISYEGDLSTPPTLQEKPTKSNRKIRDGIYNNEEDDDLDDYINADVNGKGDTSKARNFDLTEEEAAELGLNDGDEK